MVRLKYLRTFYPTIDSSCEYCTPNRLLGNSLIYSPTPGNSTDAVIWSDIETYTAVICSCLMCIRPLLIKCFPALFPSSNGNSDPKSNSKLSNKSVSSGLRSPWKIRSSRFNGKLRSLGSANLSSKAGDGDDEVFVIKKPDNVETRRKGAARNREALELEERGMTPETPTTLGRGRDMESSVEDLGFYHGREN